MPRKTQPVTVSQAVSNLRGRGFDVQDLSGGQTQVSKGGCAAVLTTNADGTPALAGQPGLLIQGEIARVEDRGFQKFVKTSKVELPATSDRLRAIHTFTEELKEAAGTTSLYNESLGTVSDRYLYDRVKGRVTAPIGS